MKAQTNNIGCWLVFDSHRAQLRVLNGWHCCFRSNRRWFCTIYASWWWWTVLSTFYGKLRKLTFCKRVSEGENCSIMVLTQLSTKTFLSIESLRNDMTFLLLVNVRPCSGKWLAEVYIMRWVQSWSQSATGTADRKLTCSSMSRLYIEMQIQLQGN
jgi:hypothetical protein